MRSQKVRFGLVGAFNTVLDVTIYGVLSWLGLGIIAANFISTSVGMTFSYFLNRSFTFKATSEKRSREIALFFTVTLFGLWVLHPVIIGLTTEPAEALFRWLPDSLLPLVPKSMAVIVSLVWNYLWYSRIVFKKTTKDT